MTTSNRLLAALLLMMIFVAGGIAGAVTVKAFARNERATDFIPPFPADPFTGPLPRPRGFAPSGFVARLSRDLELSQIQHDSIEAILEQQRTAAEETLREMGPRLRARVDSTTAQIRRVLSEDQQKRFDEIIQDDRAMLGRGFRRPPPGFPRP